MERAVRKDIGHLDEMCRRLIAAAPMLFIGTYSAEGRATSARAAGRPASSRCSTTSTSRSRTPPATAASTRSRTSSRPAAPRVIFVIPGRDTTLRVNGAARVTAEPELLEQLTPVGKPPRTAIVLEAEEVYAHCPKAFVRSKLWDPASWPDPAALPTPAEVSVAHQRDPELERRAGGAAQAESLLHRPATSAAPERLHARRAGTSAPRRPWRAPPPCVGGASDSSAPLTSSATSAPMTADGDHARPHVVGPVAEVAGDVLGEQLLDPAHQRTVVGGERLRLADQRACGSARGRRRGPSPRAGSAIQARIASMAVSLGPVARPGGPRGRRRRPGSRRRPRPPWRGSSRRRCAARCPPPRRCRRSWSGRSRAPRTGAARRRRSPLSCAASCALAGRGRSSPPVYLDACNKRNYAAVAILRTSVPSCRQWHHLLGNLAAAAASHWKRSLAIVLAVLVTLGVLGERRRRLLH